MFDDIEQNRKVLFKEDIVDSMKPEEVSLPSKGVIESMLELEHIQPKIGFGQIKCSISMVDSNVSITE